MHRDIRHHMTWAVIAALAVATPSMGATTAQKCAQSKNKEAGKYAYCRQKVEAKFAVAGDAGARTTALAKCLDKYAGKWPLYESKAVAAGGVCPSVGDQADIQGAIDAHTSEIATALLGGPFANCPVDLAACQAEPHGRPLQTGQTGCWDSDGNPVACAGTGLDGDIQAGVPRARELRPRVHRHHVLVHRVRHLLQLHQLPARADRRLGTRLQLGPHRRWPQEHADACSPSARAVIRFLPTPGA